MNYGTANLPKKRSTKSVNYFCTDMKDANKCIVFHHARYAIFYLYEILILCGKTVLKPHGVPDKISMEDVFRKHGAMVE